MKSNLRRSHMDSLRHRRTEVVPVSLELKSHITTLNAEKDFLRHLNLVQISEVRKRSVDVTVCKNFVHGPARKKLCDTLNSRSTNHASFSTMSNVNSSLKLKSEETSNGKSTASGMRQFQKRQWLKELKSLQNKRNAKHTLISNQQFSQSSNILWSSPSQITLGTSSSFSKDSYVLDSKQQYLLAKQFQLKGEVQKFVDKYSTKVEISSPLGRKLVERAPHTRVREAKEECVRAYELSCTTNCRQMMYKLQNTSNISCVPVSSRLLRSNNLFNGDSDINWGSHCCHSYTFSKRERLDKWAFLETGLNWKGRILSWSCSPVSVSVFKMDLCPNCGETLMSGNMHSCSIEEESDSDEIETDDDSKDLKCLLPKSLCVT